MIGPLPAAYRSTPRSGHDHASSHLDPSRRPASPLSASWDPESGPDPRGADGRAGDQMTRTIESVGRRFRNSASARSRKATSRDSSVTLTLYSGFENSG